MILALYLVILLWGLSYCFLGRPGREGYLERWVLFLVVLAYFVVTRFSPPQVDFNTYTNTLRLPVSAMMLKSYFYKEWAYWVVASGLYSVTKSAPVTFLLFDFYSLWAIFRARRNLGLPLYFCAIALLIFTSVFGVHNVYRQYLASCTLLLALSYERGARRWGFFVLAGFFHNAAFLFAPLLYVYRLPGQELKRGVKRFCALAASVLVFLPWAATTKSFAETGLSLGPAYVGIMCLFLVLVLSFDRWVIWPRYRGVVLTSLYFTALTTGSLAILGPAQAERVGMIALFLLLPMVVWYIEHRVVERYAARLIATVIITAPTFLFSAPRDFLI